MPSYRDANARKLVDHVEGAFTVDARYVAARGGELRCPPVPLPGVGCWREAQSLVAAAASRLNVASS